MIRPAELAAIKRGEIDLAFRRWDRPRVVVGHPDAHAGRVWSRSPRSRGPTSSRLTADDARRAGAASAKALREALAARSERPAWRIGLTWAGEDPRVALRAAVPAAGELTQIEARLDRLDRASPIGPWTRATLDLIDRNPEVRAPDLAARGRAGRRRTSSATCASSRRSA